MKYTIFEEYLLTAGLSLEKFSILTDTPLSTIKGWKTSRKNNETAKWVKPYLNIYIKNNKNEIIIET